MNSNNINLSRIDFGRGEAPWLTSVGSKPLDSKPTIHLAAANGLPVASYSSLIELLGKQHPITAMDCRAAWPKRSVAPRGFGVEDFAQDLIDGIEFSHNKPVIGLGHSHGGLVTAAAAVIRPDLFSKLVIIEGASWPNFWQSIPARLLPRELLIQMSPFIRGSHQRRAIWDSRDEFYERYQQHGTFKRFTERDLRAYAEHGLFKREDGQYELVFDPAWEAYIFCSVGFLWSFIRHLAIPTLLIRAEHSNVYTKAQFHKNNLKLGQHIEPIELADTHHLLTHEQPELVAESVLKWLA